MKTITHTPALDLAAEQQELTTIALESLGWVPLEPSAYLHVEDTQTSEIVVVGIPQAGAAVLWLVG